MPNYKGHLVGGAVAFAITFFILKNHQPTLLTSIEWFFFTVVGALFPDIDTKSKGQKYFYRFTFLIMIFLLVQMRFKELAFVSIIALSPLLIKHRGITHSLTFIAALCFLVVVTSQIFLPKYANIIFFDTLFFFVGALSHIYLDLGLQRIFKFK